MASTLCSAIAQAATVPGGSALQMVETAAAEQACLLKVSAAEQATAHQVCAGLVQAATDAGMGGAIHAADGSGCTVLMQHGGAIDDARSTANKAGALLGAAATAAAGAVPGCRYAPEKCNPNLYECTVDFNGMSMTFCR